MSNLRHTVTDLFPQQFPRGHFRGFSIGPGWKPVVEKACREVQRALSTDDLRKFHWLQIKEKCGRLAMYFGPSPIAPDTLTPAARECVEEIVERAWEEAERTCELCGAPGGRGAEGIYVLCDTCRESRTEG